MTNKELMAICKALNVIFDNLPLKYCARDENEFAKWIVGELCKNGMRIRWSEALEKYYPPNKKPFL